MLCISCRKRFNNFHSLFSHTCLVIIKPFLDELPEDEQKKIYDTLDKPLDNINPNKEKG